MSWSGDQVEEAYPVSGFPAGGAGQKHPAEAEAHLPALGRASPYLEKQVLSPPAPHPI